MKRQNSLLIFLCGAVLLIQLVPNFQAFGSIQRPQGAQPTAPGEDNQASVQCAAGKLDPLFGNAGKITADFAAVDIAYDLAIQADGKVVVVGGAQTDFALARFDSNGALDPTFGGGTGKVVTDLADTHDCAYAVAIQTDGKIVIAGETGLYPGSRIDFAILRYNSDGSLDSTFGNGGVVKTDFYNDDDRVKALAIQTDGKIVVAGYASNNAIAHDFALARYNSDGSLDENFGFQGKVITSFFLLGGDEYAEALVLQPDGKILVAGEANSAGLQSNFAIARYTNSGSLDMSFGAGGKVLTDFFGYAGQARSIAIQADRKILVAGRANNDSGYDFALARYQTDGSLDPTFGTDGKVTSSFSTNQAQAVAVQADGRILAAGGGGSSDFVIARYNKSGSPDLGFGDAGKLITDFGPADNAYAIAIQADGKFIVGGENGTDFAIARYASTVISPTGKSFTQSAGTGTITLTEPNDCDWFAASNAAWITLTSPPRGSGSAILTYEVDTNVAPVHRVGTISVAGQTFTVKQSARFDDVPPTHPFFTEINQLSASGVTLGCGDGNYCPDGFVTRDQMAIFISRALGQFNPPVPAQQRFQDVPPDMPSYPFVEELAARGITAGCSEAPPFYCPQDVVTREQMAVFIIRALGVFHPPMPAQQRFVDVPPSGFGYEYIEVMAARGITVGCFTEPPLYCPLGPVTRAQMAAFLVKAFNL